MTARPEILVRGGTESSLIWTTLLSALLHVVVIGLVLVVPHHFVHVSAPLVSYTVDLVSPNQVGGTNLHAGPKGQGKAAPALPRDAAAETKPAPPVEPKSEPARSVEEKPVVVPPVPPAAKVEPKPVQKVQLPPVAAKVEPIAKVPAPAVPKPPALPSLKTKPQPVAAKPALAKPAPAPAAKAEARPASPASAPPSSSAQSANRTDAKVGAAAVNEVSDEARVRDDAIQAAVRRRAGAAADSGSGTGGGPLSMGPGQGAGGIATDAEYIIYLLQVREKIKQSWVWSGVGANLEAIVRFEMTAAGEVVNISIVRSSGDASFDASVERALRAASPLGSPPDKHRAELMGGVEITFRPEDLRS